VALARPAPSVESVGSLLFAAEAAVEGEIAAEPTGTGGFGYDPIFHYPPYGTTLAAVDDDRKLAVAHRGKAFRLFRAWFEAMPVAERSTFLAR
jgi:inosine/xanthosine triphosphate pyrophosphatase family protein